MKFKTKVIFCVNPIKNQSIYQITVIVQWLTYHWNVLVLFGGHNLGEEPNPGERRHIHLGEHEIEVVPLIHQQNPRLEPIRDCSNCNEELRIPIKKSTKKTHQLVRRPGIPW